MARPRVIIADTDLNYVAPLQLKFAKEFFEQIDVEIITSAEYFWGIVYGTAKSRRAHCLRRTV